MTNPKNKNRQKVQRLAQMARDLRAGEHFEITRLTTIKSLAQEPKAANRFGLYLAEKANEVIQKSEPPKGMPKGDWQTGQNIAVVAIEEMRSYVKRRSKKPGDNVSQLAEKTPKAPKRTEICSLWSGADCSQQETLDR